MFCNRDKFDLIAIYDDASETPGPSDAPLSKLERAIYETAFRKILKRVPVLLIGGLEAWKREFSQRELVVAEAPFSVPTSLPPALPPTEVFVPPSPQPQLPQPQLPQAPRPSSGVSATSPTLETFRALPPVPRNPPLASDVRSPPPLPDNHPHRSFDQGSTSPQYGNFVVDDALDVLTAFASLPLSHRLPDSREPPSEPVRRLQRKPTMTRLPSVSSLNATPRTISEGVRFPLTRRYKKFPMYSFQLNSRRRRLLPRYHQPRSTAPSNTLKSRARWFRTTPAHYSMGLQAVTASLHPLKHPSTCRHFRDGVQSTTTSRKSHSLSLARASRPARLLITLTFQRSTSSVHRPPQPRRRSARERMRIPSRCLRRRHHHRRSRLSIP